MDAKARQQVRAEEIRAKKDRLAELKRTRNAKAHELQSSRLSIGERSDVAQPSPSRADREKEIQNLLASIEDRSPRTTSRSRPGSVISSRPLSGQRLSSDAGGDNTDVASPVSGHTAPSYSTTSTQTLVISPLVTLYEIPADSTPEVITYSKGVQTAEQWEPQRTSRDAGQGDGDGDGDDLWADEDQDPKRNQRKEQELEKIREQLRKEVEEELKETQDSTNVTSEDASKEERFPLRSLTNDELEAVLTSNDFKEFVDQSSKVIDRALEEQYDLLIDYAQGADNLDEDDGGYSKGGSSRRGRRVKQVAQYWDERWSKKRMISDIDFSPKYPELLLTAYTKNPSAPHDPTGIIQIWNSHMPSRPEYVFHASSDILTAKFSPFHPNLLVGGCYSGQVLLWDTRTKSPNPVQKTPLTGLGHTHPVYSLDIVGTQNANNIVSCSTDGAVCTWAVDMLAQPQEKLELHVPPPAKSEDVAPQCIAFPPADPTYFLAGSEEGTIYACHRYERAGAKAGIDSRVTYAGHAAPVMALDFHPARGPVDLSDLVISASMDWTVKLWRVRPPASLGTAVTGGTTAQGPIMDMLREDLVFDAKWSPVRPGVFALVDGAGALEVWDVNYDIEVPVAKAMPTQDMGATWPKRSLNKCAWEPNEGKKIAVGGLDGVVTVFEVGSELGGTEGAKTDQWTQVKKAVARAEAQLGAKAAVNGR